MSQQATANAVDWSHKADRRQDRYTRSFLRSLSDKGLPPTSRRDFLHRNRDHPQYHCAELRGSVPLIQRVEWVSGIGQDDAEPVVLAEACALASRCPKVATCPLTAEG